MGGVVKKIGEFIGNIVESIVEFVGDIFSFILSPFGMPDMPDQPQADQAAQGVTINKQGTNQAIPVIYGYRRSGGIIVHAETGSTNNQYLWVVWAIS